MAEETLEITQTEIVAMLGAIGLEEVLNDDKAFAAYADYIFGAVERGRLAAEPVLFEQVRRQLTREFTAAELEAARVAVDRQASTLAKRMVEGQVKKLDAAIDRGLQAGRGPRQVARSLDMVEGLTAQGDARVAKFRSGLRGLDLEPEEFTKRAKRFEAKLLRERKELIAKSEMRYSTSKSNEIKATARKDNWKRWITSGKANVDPECQANEAEGWIPKDQAHASGHMHPLAHPDCVCTEAYRRAAPDKFAKKTAEEKAARTKAAVEEGQAEESQAKKAAKAERDKGKPKPEPKTKEETRKQTALERDREKLSALKRENADSKAKLEALRIANQNSADELARLNESRVAETSEIAAKRQQVRDLESELKETEAATKAIDDQLRREDVAAGR